MRILAIAISTLIIGLSWLELTSETSSLWAYLFVSPDYFAVRMVTATCLLLLSRQAIPVLFRPIMRRIGLGVAGALALICSAIALDPSALPQDTVLLASIRFAASLTLSYPVAFLISFHIPAMDRSDSPDGSDLVPISKWSPLGIGLVLATVIPFSYGHFLSDYYSNQLTEALKNQRLELARSASGSWSRLSPQARWQNQPVAEIHGQLTSEVGRIRNTLSELSTGQIRSNPGMVASMFLQVDNFDGAVRIIEPHLRGTAPSPFAWDTFGLILQRQELWQESEQAYRKAFDLWNQQTGSSNENGLASALRGIAHAQNRQGRVRNAERTYKELLEIDSSAETHFLLAQFYEEEQQTEEAYHHASEAMILAPAQFQQPGQTLINKLQSAHMGCFQIYRRPH